MALILSNTPTHICDVTVPSGVDMYMGMAASSSNGIGGGIQFEFDDTPSQDWFSNIRELS